MVCKLKFDGHSIDPLKEISDYWLCDRLKPCSQAQGGEVNTGPTSTCLSHLFPLTTLPLLPHIPVPL